MDEEAENKDASMEPFMFHESVIEKVSDTNKNGKVLNDSFDLMCLNGMNPEEEERSKEKKIKKWMPEEESK